MFAGYDLFREGKIRRFWARSPGSTLRPRALERLYPYLSRSPVSQQAMAKAFFGRNLQNYAHPGFAHETRWQTTSALKRMFTGGMRDALGHRNVIGEFIGTLPAAFARWSALAQDQYIEISTLLSGYLLSSQGDRMLMAHSIEGRFPFLDKNVVALAESLPDRYKLRALDEKYILKRAAKGIVPEAIIERQKQPYRAPDAASFVGDTTPEYVEAMLGADGIRRAGVFEPKAVAQLWSKCRSRASAGQFSNTDNMALVGVLSTQLLHDFFVRQRPGNAPAVSLAVDIEGALAACG
jgi:asparagine synthase (glutamine-hydrolysing)